MNRTIGNIRVYATPEALAIAAAEEFFMRAFQARTNGQIFSCALSGGSTPARMLTRMSDFETLARLPAGFWNYVHFFWGDERDVPLDHPDSNFRLAREALFDKIDIPEENLHPIQAGFNSTQATAISYEN